MRAAVDFRVGFWLILLLFFCAMCLHGVNAVRRTRSRRREALPEPHRQKCLDLVRQHCRAIDGFLPLVSKAS